MDGMSFGDLLAALSEPWAPSGPSNVREGVDFSQSKKRTNEYTQPTSHDAVQDQEPDLHAGRDGGSYFRDGLASTVTSAQSPDTPKSSRTDPADG
jgi:predicted alpha/beta superfamily hydrolase